MHCREYSVTDVTLVIEEVNCDKWDWVVSVQMISLVPWAVLWIPTTAKIGWRLMPFWVQLECSFWRRSAAAFQLPKECWRRLAVRISWESRSADSNLEYSVVIGRE